MGNSPNSKVSNDCKDIHMKVPGDEFTCPMCCDIFEEPKQLPNCSHSYCKACLRELTLRGVNSAQVSCPVCRKMSNVPQNGVEGFVTNTLLVRLIDNIPGQKDKQLVVKALGRCKEEITKNKDVQEPLEKKLAKIQDNKEHGLRLKRDVTEHAQQAIDSIRKWEQYLCKEVDLYLAQNCGLDFHERLEEQRNKWKNHMDQASACVKSAEEMMERNEMGEILEMRKAIVEQLNEYSSFPLCPSLQEVDKIQDFAMTFDKLDVKQDLGKVVKPDQKEPLLSSVSEPTASGSGRSEPAKNTDIRKIPLEVPLQFTAITGVLKPAKKEPANDPPVFCTSLRSQPTASASGRSELVRDMYNGKINSEVTLPLTPCRMAVCPRSGEVALLWRERKQVHLYRSNGVILQTIAIKHGDLCDVGFTKDNEIVVVNREHNRLLLYDSNMQFVNFEFITPRDSLKFTYVSVDSEGRLIVTSTYDDNDEDDDVVPCIIVYNNDRAVSCMMFGRHHLVNPVSRAIFHNGQFYIADKCDLTTIIKIFSFQGQHIRDIRLPETSSRFTCLSTVPHSSIVFLYSCSNNGKRSSLNYILDDCIIGSKEQQNPYPGLQQALVMSGGPDGPVEQLEIYEFKNCLCRVKYY